MGVVTRGNIKVDGNDFGKTTTFKNTFFIPM
jgi:hypothetical protein